MSAPRLRWFFGLTIGLAVACNAILGIDGDVIDATNDAATTDGPTVPLGQIRLVDSTLTMRQGTKASVRVEVAPSPGVPPDPTRRIRLPTGELVRGVSVQETLIAEGETRDVPLVATPFARLGASELTLKLDDGRSLAPALRLVIEGNLDDTFGDGGIAHVPAVMSGGGFDNFGLFVHPVTGRILVAARKAVNGVDVPFILAFDKDGKIDPSFGKDGVYEETSQGAFEGLDMIPDGSYIAVGRRGGANSDANAYAAIVAGTGAFVREIPFVVTSVKEKDELRAVARTPTALWVLAEVGGAGAAPLFGDLNADAGPDGGWPLPGKNAGALIVLGDGLPLFSSYNTGGARSGFLSKRLGDGGPDPSFAGDGQKLTLGSPDVGERIMGFALDDAGQIVGVGARDPADAAVPPRLMARRFSRAGATDGTFGDAGLVEFFPGEAAPQQETYGRAVAMMGNKLLVAGYVGTYQRTDHRILVARLDETGRLDPSFALDGLSIIERTSHSEAWRAVAQGGSVIVACQVTDALASAKIILVRYVP